MHGSSDPTYVPAAGRDWLLPFYDPFTRFLGVGKYHRALIIQASIHSGQRVLEIGCGTGNMAILAKRMNPSAEIVGIDPDSHALELARRKANRSRLTIDFNLGFSEELKFPQGSFDRVLSAFMFHHVKPGAKLSTLQECLRVLKPGGSLHLVDFVETQARNGGLHGFLASMAHSQHGGSSQDLVLGSMRDAGFTESEILLPKTTLMGKIVFYQAKAAGGTV